MLNDPPEPADLPDVPDEPYAALDGSEETSPAAGVTPRPGPARSSPGRRGARPVVAGAIVVVLLLVLGIVVWQWPGRGAPVAAPNTPSSTSTPAPSGSSGGPITSAPSTPSPASTDHPAALDRFYRQPVAWSGCPDNRKHECARVDVPVDYDEPDGDTFSVALRKVPALDPAKRVGSMLVNPGGPGGSGLEYAQYASYVLSRELRQAYDIVGLDPRGVGASDGVTCLTDADMDRLFAVDPTPDTEAERQELLDGIDGIATSCASRGGDKALHMGSTEVARDMDVIRALVGDEQLNYLGVSYGTFLGALYADLFPDKVGRFVLDSAMSPNQTAEQEMEYDIQGFDSSMDAFLDWCVARDDCALGTDKAAATTAIVDLLDRVDEQPLRTTKPGLPTIGEGWVGFAIFMCLYSDTTWSTLNNGLAEAIEQGSGDILLSRAFAVVERSSSGDYADTSYLHAIIPVRCADWPRTEETPAARAAQDRAKQDHPLWARMTGELYDMCEQWPEEGRTPSGDTLGQGAAPILVIGNLRDPATPIGGTKQLAADLESGVLITADHDGHGTYFAGNLCVDGIVDDYMINGTVPADGTEC